MELGLALGKAAETPFKLVSPLNDPLSLPESFKRIADELETSLGQRVVFLIEGSGPGSGPVHRIGEDSQNAILGLTREDLAEGKPVALVIHSAGGDAHCGYRMARALQKHCGGFTAVVPHRAKSAATLLALGADRIVLGRYGELGPLDTQITDLEDEDTISALDRVNALEELAEFAANAFDRTMHLMQSRWRAARIKTIVPFAESFAIELTKPLLSGIDAVAYTQTLRTLAVATDYAKRLLAKNYDSDEADEIARRLCLNYPDHGFVVDATEAESVGLRVEELERSADLLLNALLRGLRGNCFVGIVKDEGNTDGQDEGNEAEVEEPSVGDDPTDPAADETGQGDVARTGQAEERNSSRPGKVDQPPERTAGA